MDFEAIWQKHQQFIMKVGAAALLFLALYYYSSSNMAEASQLARQASSAKRQMLSSVEDLEGAEGREKGRATYLETDLQQKVSDSLLWQPDDRFVGGGRSDETRYIEARQKCQELVDDKVKEFAADCPRTWDKLGLPETIGGEDLGTLLAQCDLLQRVLRAVLDAGVRKVRLVDLGDVDYQPLPAQGGFIREVGLEIEFEATSPVLAKVLQALQERGSFLELVECEHRRDGPDPGDPQVSKLYVRALSKLAEKPSGAKRGGSRRGSKSGGGGGDRGRLRFGR